MIRKIAIVALAFALGACASAQQITYTGSVPRMSVNRLEDGAELTLESSRIQLLGRNEDGSFLLYVDGDFLVVSQEEFSGTLGQLSGAVPEVADFHTQKKGDVGQPVLALQTALKALGFMKGRVDGNYGEKSASAVRDFQASAGLEETGEADPLTQMLALSMAAEGEILDGVTSLRALFPDVDGASALDGMEMEYDEVSGTGFLSDGSVVEYDVPGETLLTEYHISVRSGLRIGEQITPVIEVCCLCVSRPLMASLILKTNYGRVNLTVSELSTSIEGVKSLEKAIVELDPEAVSELAQAWGEATLRIEGKLAGFDVPLEDVGFISAIAELAMQLQ